jgi:thiamine-phosphate pyrophosphorylase
LPNQPDAARFFRRLPRLYAILDVDLARSRGLEPLTLADTWLEAGVRLIQLRAKTLGDGAFLDLAAEIASASSAAGAIFVVNDRADLALMSGAGGVHVGQEDLPPDQVRSILGGDAVVGLSTHNDDQARAAMDAAVTYLAIGPVFGTMSKAEPDPVVGLDGVRRVRALLHTADGAQAMPIVGIGGITVERAPAVLDAGAESVAVISDLLVGDPAERCRQYLKVLE